MTIKTSESTSQNIAVDVKSLSKFFGTDELQVSALDGVSVAIRENEFFVEAFAALYDDGAARPAQRCAGLFLETY
jgi:hypothetical protein